MLIETDDYVTLAQGAKESKMAQAVFYRTAHRLGVAVAFFDKYLILKADVQKVIDGHLGAGNPVWARDHEAAVRNGIQAAKLSLKARGLTPRKKSTSSHAASGKRGKGA